MSKKIKPCCESGPVTKRHENPLMTFTRNELHFLESLCEGEEQEQQKEISVLVLTLMEILSSCSLPPDFANFALKLFARLSKMKPVSPLTGEDAEWNIDDYKESDVKPNKRCPSVYKYKDGSAFYTEGFAFSNNQGKTWFTAKGSTVSIDFPFNVPDQPIKLIIGKDEDTEEVVKKYINLQIKGKESD